LVLADYEPPVMQSCLGFMEGTLGSEDHFINIFKTYLGEEFFINYLLARKINNNLNDFSTVYNVKGHDFIPMLKANFNSRYDVEVASKDWKILVKLPNLSRSVRHLISANSKIVLTHRNMDEVISSGLLKGWYDEKYLLTRPSWPYIIVDNFPVPYWVSKNLTESWVRGDDIDRALINYYEMQKVINSLAICRDCIDLQYEMLVSDPVTSLEKIFNFLSLKQGPRTASLIEKVKPQESTSNCRQKNGVQGKYIGI
jgi:hypothetical protein